MLNAWIEMCKYGKHTFCVNTVNTLEVLSGFLGIILLSVGFQFMHSVEVTVGKVPFAWFAGFLSIVLGTGLSLTMVTTVTLKKRPNELWVTLVFGLLLTGSGIYNIFQNPRSEVICNCLPGYYGSDSSGFLPECLKCNCGSGRCMDTVYGDGTCVCPPRFDPDADPPCSECIEGAEPEGSCDRCKVGWRYASNLSSASCRECSPGYRKYNGKCDFVSAGVITHTCQEGWETECFDQVGLLPPWTGTGKTDCSLDSIGLRTVICDKCKANHTTRDCTPCPDCAAQDKDAECTMNEPRTATPTLSAIACYDDYDCGSFQCSDGFCANEIRERSNCKCGSSNFAGPFCENCTSNEVDIGLTCVQGVCQYHAAKKETYCMCNSGYESPSGYCTKKILTGECEPNYWGSGCERCGCKNGACNDRSTGDGKCKSCAYNTAIWTGYGMWSGDYCDECAPGPQMVGCGDQCLPTPEQQVNHTENGPRWMSDGSVCGEVQRCDRVGLGPCLMDCSAGGGSCPRYRDLKTLKSRTHRCTQAETYNPWYTCTPVDCSDNPCVHSENCTDTNDGYDCGACDAGYEGHNCDIDINECAGNPCGDVTRGYCTDLVGGFECTCNEGYTGVPCE